MISPLSASTSSASKANSVIEMYFGRKISLKYVPSGIMSADKAPVGSVCGKKCLNRANSA